MENTGRSHRSKKIQERETLQRMAQQSQSSEQSAREVNDVGSDCFGKVVQTDQ